MLVLSGLRRSSAVNVTIVSMTVLALGAFAIAGVFSLSGPDTAERFNPFFTESVGLPALLHATALMFVAFTGYGRIATMGEEVTAPRRTIPRAILATLIVSAMLYISVAVAAIGAVGAQALGGATGGHATPLETAARALEVPGLSLLVALGAVTAMLGVLLNLILGLSRVALAMGRRGDLPPALGRLNHASEPRAAILFVGAVVAAIALIGDVKTIWSFSALTVLVYYALTNLAALRLPKDQRLYPRWISWAGLGGCVLLTFYIPVLVWLAGGTLLALGFAIRLALRHMQAGKSGPHRDHDS